MKSRVLIIPPRSGFTPSYDNGGRLHSSGPERLAGPVELRGTLRPSRERFKSPPEPFQSQPARFCLPPKSLR